MEYFSDIELGEKERISEEITEGIHNGIVAIYKQYAAKNCFSESSPVDCPDIPGICGFNEKRFLELAKGVIQNLDLGYPEFKVTFQRKSKKTYDKYMILDFIQFCHSHIKKAREGNHIPYIHGLTGDDAFALSYTFEESDNEKEAFRNDINTLFRRNGLVFELQEDGKIIRTIPQGLQPLLSKIYLTEDEELNKLVEEAFEKFLEPKLNDRKIALEKMWDAFERMKTYYNENKKKSIEEMISDAVKGNEVIQEILQTEAKSLTKIGNGKREDGSDKGLKIRHHERNKIDIESNEHIDLLFYRMVSFMQLFLKHLEDKKD